jgi:hypothetical protein
LAGARASRLPLVALVALVVLSLLGAACDSTDASPSPSVAPSIEPSASASAPAGSIAPTAPTDFSDAADGLAELDSYSFSVIIRAENTQAGQAVVKEGTTTMSGTVVNTEPKASSLHLTTAGIDGKVTDETEIIVIGDTSYLRSGGAAGSWQTIPADQAEGFNALMDGFRPEKMFALYFGPVAADNTTVGDEERNGVETTHYRGGEDVAELLGSIAGVLGAWSSDIWIARDGGYLVASEAGVQGSDANGGGSFTIKVDIKDVNSAGPLAAPL